MAKIPPAVNGVRKPPRKCHLPPTVAFGNAAADELAATMIVLRREAMDLGLMAAAAVTLPAAAMPDRTARPQPGDIFVSVSDRKTPLRAEAVHPGAAPVLAWPMERESRVVRDGARFNQVLLLRVAMEKTGEIVAFTAICPHAGCTVSEWKAQTSYLHCPCHGSEYDPAKNGMVVAGPSPFPLPTLPVKIVDGLVTVAGPFSAPPGGHTSRTM
jgi:rieske iron-sulfur protein